MAGTIEFIDGRPKLSVSQSKSAQEIIGSLNGLTVKEGESVLCSCLRKIKETKIGF